MIYKLTITSQSEGEKTYRIDADDVTVRLPNITFNSMVVGKTYSNFDVSAFGPQFATVASFGLGKTDTHFLSSDAVIEDATDGELETYNPLYRGKKSPREVATADERVEGMFNLLNAKPNPETEQ